MNIYNDVFEHLRNGKELVFLKSNNTFQRFKVISGILHDFQNGEWVERTYLPQWTDLAKGSWFVSL